MPIEKVGNARREATESVDPLISHDISHDLFCEELSHPHLCSYGKFGFQINHQISLSPTKYFNQHLLNYTHKLSSDLEIYFLDIRLCKV